MSRSPRRARDSRKKVAASPRPRRPSPARGGAFVPHVEPAGPPGSAHPPPHPPCRGHVGTRPEAPPALLHVGGARNSRLGKVPMAPESQGHPPNDIPGHGACGAPVVRLRAFDRDLSTQTSFPTTKAYNINPKSPPTPGGAPGAHLHDAVRGLGCRHLHPHLLLLRPPRPPPFPSLPRDRLIPALRPAHRNPF